jgi:sulfur-oxidizing protein SoxX
MSAFERRYRLDSPVRWKTREDTKLSGRIVLSLTAGLSLLWLTGFGADAAELVRYKIVGEGIPKSLTGKPGDAKKGRKLAINRKKGNCLACHKMPIPEQAFHGEVGPDLKGVAGRYSEAQLRLRVVNPKKANPDTIMPAFYRNTGFHRVMKKFKGKTIIGAQDVEDIVAYLKTLK